MSKLLKILGVGATPLIDKAVEVADKFIDTPEEKKAFIKEAYEQDKTTPCGDIKKLGTYSKAFKSRKHEIPGTIINMYTQFEPGARFEYKAFMDAMKKLERDYKGSDVIFGFPQIGCGIGGGSWPYVRDILNKSKLNIIIVHYDHGIETVGKAKVSRSTKLERQ